MRSGPVLHGFFGIDWPLGHTLADHHINFAWHQRERTLCWSYGRILRDLARLRLGCADLFPEHRERGCGQIYLSAADIRDRLVLLATFEPLLANLLQPWLPAGALYDWHGRCCTTLIVEDSHCESMRLDGRDEQAITRPLPHDELVQLHSVASEARVASDLAGQAHVLARAA